MHHIANVLFANFAALGLASSTGVCLAPATIAYQDDAGPCREGPSIVDGLTCTAACAPDYTPSVQSLSCNASVLTPSSFDCLAGCAAPVATWITGVAPAGACAEGDRISHGAACTAQCRAGLSPSAARLECSSGVLAPRLFACLARCPAPSGVVAAAEDGPCHEGTAIAHGGRCTAACAAGYTPSVPALECLAGSLLPQTFRCEPDCPAPRGIANAGLEGACREGPLVPFGRRCTAACDVGFTPFPPALACGASGALAPAQFACRRMCEAPDEVDHASPRGVCLEGGSVVSGGACTVACAEGFLPSTARLQCSDGVLQPGSTQCRKHCRPPVGIPNAPAVGACARAPQSIVSGDACVSVCGEGFSPDVDQLVCMDGLLIPSRFNCVGDCEAPSGVVLASPNGTCGEGRFVQHGRNCTASCAPGSAPSVSTLRCEYGLLQPESFRCESLCFGRDLEHLNASGSCAEVRDGGTCEAQCLPGFAPSAPVLSCNGGAWQPPGFRCAPLRCRVPEVAGAAQAGACAEGAWVEHGASCGVRCALGYEAAQPAAPLCSYGSLSPGPNCTPSMPWVVLEGPGGVTACTSVVVSAEASPGLFDQPPLSASWTCSSPLPLCLELQPFFAVANGTVLVFDVSDASLNASSPGSNLSLTFALTNFLGQAGSASLFLPLIRAPASVPAVEAVGQARLTRALGASVTFQLAQRQWGGSHDLSGYRGAGAGCPGQPPVYEVEWKRRPLNDPHAAEELFEPLADLLPSASALRLTLAGPLFQASGDWAIIAEAFHAASRAAHPRLYSRLVFVLHVTALPPTVCRFGLASNAGEVAATATLLLAPSHVSEHGQQWHEAEVPVLQEPSLRPEVVAAGAGAAVSATGTLRVTYRWTDAADRWEEEQGVAREADEWCGMLVVKAVRCEGLPLPSPTLRLAVSCKRAAAPWGFELAERRLGLGKAKDTGAAGDWHWEVPESKGLFIVNWHRAKLKLYQVVSVRQYFSMTTFMAPEMEIQEVAAELQYFFWSAHHLLGKVARRESLWHQLNLQSPAISRVERFVSVACALLGAAVLATVSLREDCAYEPPPALCVRPPRVAEALFASASGTLIASPAAWLIRRSFWRRVYLEFLDEGQRRVLSRVHRAQAFCGWLMALTALALSTSHLVRYTIHYDWAVVHTWLYSLGFNLLHSAFSMPGIRTVFAFAVLEGSKLLPVFDGFLLMVPWISHFDPVPVTYPHAGELWRREQTRARWRMVRDIVMGRMLRFAMTRRMTTSESSLLSDEVHLEGCPLALADGAL